MKYPSPEDVLLAHRYLYYVKVQPVISDAEYDRMERKYQEDGPDEASPMNRPGSDCEDHYSEAHKVLAQYLTLAYSQ